MEVAKRIEKKLDKLFEIIRKKDQEIELDRKVTRALYKQLLKVKGIKHEQENNKCS